MTYDELLKNRRSIRQYKDTSVPLDIIQDIIKESTLAPSSGNDQPWKFIIVNNTQLMKRISDDSKKNILVRIAANPDHYAKKYQSMLENPSFNVFYNAPCLVIILGHSEVRNLYGDCALAAGYFMMSAVSRGLGTCWVNLGKDIQDPDIIHELGIPDTMTIVAPLALGYPETIPPAPQRNDPEILNIIQ